MNKNSVSLVDSDLSELWCVSGEEVAGRFSCWGFFEGLPFRLKEVGVQ